MNNSRSNAIYSALCKFAVFYMVSLVLFGLTNNWIQQYYNSYTISFVLGMLVCVVSTLSASEQFVKVSERLPTKEECVYVTNYSFVLTYVCSILIAIILFISSFLFNDLQVSELFSLISRLDFSYALLFVVGFIFNGVINYLLIKVCYKFFTKVVFKHRSSKSKNNTSTPSTPNAP